MSKEINIGYYDNSILEESLKVVDLKGKEEYCVINKVENDHREYWKGKLNEYINFLEKWHGYIKSTNSIYEMCELSRLRNYEGVFFLAINSYSDYTPPIMYTIHNNTSDHKAEYAKILRYDKKYRSR